LTQGVDEALSAAGTRRLFWSVIAGIVLYVLLDIIAQSLPPHYSPISDPESDLAVGPYGWIMAVNFVVRGTLSLAFLYALTKTVKAGRSFMIGTYLLGIWGVGAIVLAAFPADVPATPMSLHGTIHFVDAAIAFVGGAFGELTLSLQFGRVEALRGARVWALAIAVFSVLAFILFVSTAGPLWGLVERVFIGSVLLWLAAVSAHLARTRFDNAQLP